MNHRNFAVGILKISICQSSASSIDLLARDEWQGVSMHQLLLGQLEKFAYDPAQIELSGNDFIVRPEAVHPLSLALHELGTNAMKYGSLSVAGGKVRVEWSANTDQIPTSMEIHWTESGGPEVFKPATSGFGSTIIGPHIASTLNGSANSDFRHDGFRWSLVAPLDAFSEGKLNDRHNDATGAAVKS